MELGNAFIKANEIVHSKIEQHKKIVLSDAEFLGLTINLLIYLEAVFNLEKPSLGDVARSLNVSNASASIAVQKLIDSGFLEKEQSDSDRRVFHIQLTSKGEALIRAQKSAMDDFGDGFISSLSIDEQAILTDIFEKFIDSQRKNTA